MMNDAIDYSKKPIFYEKDIKGLLVKYGDSNRAVLETSL